jgi:putative exporter of polyketide antibiotics
MPKPLGFETRSQSNVSNVWLVLFIVIVVCEVLAMIRVQRHPKMSARLASRTYTLIAYAVGLVCLGLIYFSFGVLGYLRKM